MNQTAPRRAATMTHSPRPRARRATSLHPAARAAGSRAAVAGIALLAAACVATDPGARAVVGTGPESAPAQPRDTYVADLEASHPPFDTFHASWKQRIDQPYVYLEHFGPYPEAPTLIPNLLWELDQQGLEARSVPFVLYYDDPAQVAAAELRSRICIPIGSARTPLAPLRFDVLPSRSVAYCFVSGPYTEVPRSYPHLFGYLERFSWELDGPILERYLVVPGSVSDARDLRTEVQFPFRSKR